MAQIFSKTNDNIDSLTWSKSWLKVQDYLKRSREFVPIDRDVNSVYAELYMNNAICLIMMDGNFMRGKQSPLDVKNKINDKLQKSLKHNGHDDASIQFYPIKEWRELNPMQEPIESVS